MGTLAFGVLMGILFIAFVWWFRTQRTQPLLVRAIVPVVLIAVGVVSAISAFSTPDDVSVPERLRIVERDRALSAIPPGATLLGEGGSDCPDYGGPYYMRNYSYAGAPDSVFRFHDRRLKEAGWKPLTPSTTTSPVPATSSNPPTSTSGSTSTSLSPPPRRTPPQDPPTSYSYSKSYDRWEARATVQLRPRGGVKRGGVGRLRPFALTVTVADEPTGVCIE